MVTDNTPVLFQHGSDWVRADFHLHTRKDKQFQYDGEANAFVNTYVAGLKQADIRIGVITNHNKFDLDEFRALRKKARQEEMFLLPGVELSVNDGANGIHTLVVFSDAWIENNQDYVNQFLNVAFEGKTPDQYENENGRSSLSLLETLKKLEGYNRDFLIIFAHVEDKSGLWNELNGGRIGELGTNELFCRNTLGFQKVRTRDGLGRKSREQIKQWLGNWYPAEVEGSDCKSIEEIGKGEKCFLKLGAFSFEAVKYALSDYSSRVAPEPKKHERSYILSVSFEGGGGTLDGKTVRLSPELNVFIGIRGSGKSSILEAIRYALDIPLEEKTADVKYKNELIEHTLGSGGKVTIQAVDMHGRQYEIRRIYREQPDVYVDGTLQPGVSIRETIVHKPIYFGQKDLTATGDGFEKDLVEKLIGEKLATIRRGIEEQRQRVSEAVRRLSDLSRVEEKKKEYQDKKRDAEYRLGIYKDHGVEEKLQKQVDFESDSRKCVQVVECVRSYLLALESFVNQHEDDLRNQRVYTSRQNQTFFEEFFSIYDKVVVAFDRIKVELSGSKVILSDLQSKSREFEKTREGLKEEFAAIEQKLAAQLKEAGASAIRPEEFKELRKTVDVSKQMLDALEKQAMQRQECLDDVIKQLGKLNDLWHEEYKVIVSELEKVNQNHSALQIKVEYKGDKENFLSFMRVMLKGSRIRENTSGILVQKYSDFGAIYKDFDNAKNDVGGSADIFDGTSMKIFRLC